MNLKATILLLLFAFACAAPCVAQGKKKEPPARPDFSGTWVFDAEKSHYNNPESRLARETLAISHAEPEVRVKRMFTATGGEERTVELVYYTDGRGEKNAVVGHYDRVVLSGTAESETKWKGARLVIRGRSRVKSFGDVRELRFTEKWELSADGRTFTQTTEYDVLWAAGGGPGDVQRGAPSRTTNIDGDNVVLVPPDSKRVYNRAP